MSEYRHYPIAYQVVNDNKYVYPEPKGPDCYWLRAPQYMSIGVGRQRVVNSGLMFGMPETITMVTEQGDKVTMAMRAHLQIAKPLLLDHGLTLVGPASFTSEDCKGELVYIIENRGKHILDIDPGARILELYFTMSPPIILGNRSGRFSDSAISL